MKKIVTLFFIFFCSVFVFGQDIQFTTSLDVENCDVAKRRIKINIESPVSESQPLKLEVTGNNNQYSYSNPTINTNSLQTPYLPTTATVATTYTIVLTDANDSTISDSQTLVVEPNIAPIEIESYTSGEDFVEAIVAQSSYQSFRTFYYKLKGDSGNIIATQTNNGRFNNLSPGSYNVEIYDNFGCSAPNLGAITTTDAIDFTTNVVYSCGKHIVEVTITKNTTGSDKLDVEVDAGSNNYYTNTVNSDPANFEILQQFNVGTHLIRISNFNNPEVFLQKEFTIDSKQEINGVGTTVPDDGVIEVQVGGGNSPFTYNLYNSDNNSLVATSQQDTFTFENVAPGTYYVTVTDAIGCTAVSNDVTIYNEPSNAVDDTFTTNENASLTFNVLLNDTDADEDTLTVLSFTQPANGDLFIDTSTNLFTYTPSADFNGDDSFTYVLTDGYDGTSSAVVKITVNAVNNAPVAATDTAETVEDVAILIDVLSNDDDADGDVLSIGAINSNPTAGIVEIRNDKLLYIPNANFFGVDYFEYIVSDESGMTDIGLVYINVSSVNDTPVAVNDLITTSEDTSVTFNVLSNDSDVDLEDGLTIQSFTQPSNGIIVVDTSTGTVEYTPNTDFNGTDSFTYVLVDIDGAAANATVEIVVSPNNHVPTAATDTAETIEDSAITIDVLSNDYDVDGDMLTIQSISSNSSNGIIEILNNKVVYTPSDNYFGQDSFEYVVQDELGGTDIGLVYVNVASVNDTPVAVNDSITTTEEASVTFNILSNDSDIDLEDALTIQSFTQSSNGIIVVDTSTGFVEYSPNTDFNGTDSFTYVLVDIDGATANATVEIVVNAVNDSPIAGTDTAETIEDIAITIDVLSNDYDADGDMLTIQSISSNPLNGIIEILNNKVVYTPNANYFGQDSFEYVVQDELGGTDSAFVYINITSVNDTPVAADDSFTTTENEPITFNLLLNDIDIDSDTLSIVSATQPSNGALSVNKETGVVDYIPNTGFYGNDSFTYIVTDGFNTTDSGVVSITVNSLPDITLEVTSVDVLCYGSYGQIIAQASGGSGAYYYKLYQSDQLIAESQYTQNQTEVFDGLAEGSYTVKVIDVNNSNRYSEQIVIINSPAPLNATFETINTTAEPSGSLELFVTGGVPPYSYKINDGALQQENIFYELNEGTYNLTVVDANGCEFTLQAPVEKTNVEVTVEFQENSETIVIDINDNWNVFWYKYNEDTQEWEIIEGADEKTFAPDSAGKYRALCVFSGGSSRYGRRTDPVSFWGNIVEIAESQLSVDRITQLTVSFYPNPAKDVLNFSTDVIGKELSVFDLVGNKVLSTTSTTTKLKINDLKKGLYILKIDGYKSIKFFKK